MTDLLSVLSQGIVWFGVVIHMKRINPCHQPYAMHVRMYHLINGT